MPRQTLRTRPANWNTVRTIEPSSSRKPTPTTRDVQQGKVYRAEKIAQHLLLGDYWVASMTELQVLDLIEQVINHPAVVARWGEHNVSVSFPKKGNTAWSIRSNGRIHLPPGTRNPLTVVHELAHLFAPTVKEADHGPGFVSIYKWLVNLVHGEDTHRILEASFNSLGVKNDDTLIPAPSAERGGISDEALPGLFPGQAEQAAEIIRMAASSGMFGSAGDPLRTAAFQIARRIKNLESRITPRKPPAHIPETVTVPVASLLRANDRNDVAEIVLGAVRESMAPKPLRVIKTAAEERKAAAKRRSTAKRSTAAKATGAKTRRR